MGLRTKWYRSIAVVYAWEQAAYADDRKFTVEDIDETLWAIAGLGLIWKGDIILASIPYLNVIEAAVVVGGVASYAIGGVEGVEDYIDFITEPTKLPGRVAFTAETIYKEKILPEYTKKKGEVNVFLKVLEQLTRPYRINHWKTGPYLPF